MSNNDSYRQICEQYPPDNGIYSFDKWQVLRDILFRKFSGKKPEDRFLKRLLMKKLGHGNFLQTIIPALQEKNIPLAGQLTRFVGCVEKKFTSYSRSETSTSGYYQSILSVLRKFHSETQSFHEKIQKALDCMLCSSRLNRQHVEGRCFDREDVEDLLFDMQMFSSQLSRYNDYFMMLLDRETDKSKGRTVTTHVEHYLVKLLVVIQEMMSANRETECRLEAPLVQWTQLENQRWYN